MTTDKKHRCGGVLRDRQVVVSTGERTSLVVLVQGVVCDRCGEQLISRDTANRLSESLVVHTPVRNDPGTSRTPVAPIVATLAPA